MILAIDIGNTNIKSCLFQETKEDLSHHGIITVPTKKGSPEESTKLLLDQISHVKPGNAEISGIASSCVATELRELPERAAEYFNTAKSVTANHQAVTGICYNYDDPSKLGQDRIADMAAAKILAPGRNVIVISSGTALVFSVLLDGEKFDGGIIAPGINTAMKALSSSASNLFETDLGLKTNIVGRNTEENIRSGLVNGWLSMTEGLISRIESYYGHMFDVLITGGNGRFLSENISHENKYDPALTLKGLKIIYSMNA